MEFLDNILFILCVCSPFFIITYIPESWAKCIVGIMILFVLFIIFAIIAHWFIDNLTFIIQYNAFVEH